MIDALIYLSIVATTVLGVDTFFWMPERKRVARERQKARIASLERKLASRGQRTSTSAMEASGATSSA